MSAFSSLIAEGRKDLKEQFVFLRGTLCQPEGVTVTGQDMVRSVDNSFYFLGHTFLPKGAQVYLLDSNYL